MNHQVKLKLTPSNLDTYLNEMEKSIKILRHHANEARRKHKRMNTFNGTYDTIAYWTFQIAIANDLIRSGLHKSKIGETTKLANGSLLTW